MEFLSDILIKAGLVVEGSTALGGVSTAQTPSLGDNSTKIATTAFIKGQGYLDGSSNLDWNKVINRPSDLAGYGITNAYTKTEIGQFFSGAVAITGYNRANWDEAYSHMLQWNGGSEGLSVETARATLELGDMALESTIDYYTKVAIQSFFSGATAISGYNKSNWDNAFGWGNHALAGYFLSSDFNSTFDTRLGTKTTDNLTEGSTNLYFTNVRVRSAVSFTAGSGAYNSTTGVFTIPTNTNQLTNGAGYITSSALADYYTKTQLDDFFYGTTLIAGYNKTNWDLAYAQTRQWDGGATGLVAATGRTSLGLGTMAQQNTTSYYQASEINQMFAGSYAMTGYNKTNWDTAFGWGPHAGLYYTLGSTVANSTLWNGYGVNLATYGSNAGDFLNYDNTLGIIKPFSTAQIQAKLGLGSMAYASTGSYVAKAGDTMTGHLVMSNYNLSNVGTLLVYASGSHINIDAVRGSYFGYSASYPTLVLGTNSGNTTLAFNVDVVANPSGDFGGGGSEYLWRNVGAFKTPNAANTNYNTLFSWGNGVITVANTMNAAINGTLNTFTTATASTANTIAVRDGNGYLRAVYFYDDNTSVASSGITSMYGGNGDKYIYKYNQTSVRTFLGLGSAAYINADSNSVANTIVLRDASSDINVRLLRTEWTSTEAGNGGYILMQNSIGSGVDNYARPTSMNTLRDYMNLGDSNSTYMRYQGFTLDANTMLENRTGFTYASNAPYTGPILHVGAAGYGLQFNAAYSGGGELLAFRTRNGDTVSWNGWNSIWHEGNFTPTAYVPYTGATTNVNLGSRQLLASYIDAYNIETVNRTTYQDLLYVTANATSLPYGGHGGGILFRGSTYQQNGSNVTYARIGTIINSDSVNTYGSTMFFDIATNSSGSTARAFELYWTGKTKWFYNSEINGSDRILDLKSPGGGNNSLLRYSDGSTAKYSTGFNNSNYIIYDDVVGVYRLSVLSTGIVRIDSGTSFEVQNGRANLVYTSPGLAYTQAGTEVYSSGTYGPRLSFHWGGVVASQIGVESSGRIAILNNPGTSYENLIANNIWAATHLYVGGNIVGSGAASFVNSVSASSFAVGEMILNSNQLYRNSSNEMYLNYSGGGNTLLGNSSGNVGINAGTNPAYRLHIGGTLGVTSTITAAGVGVNIRLTGDGGAGNDGFLGADGSGNLFFRNWSGSRGFVINNANVLVHSGALSLTAPIYRTNPLGGFLHGGYAGVETSATPGLIYAIGDGYLPTSSATATMYGIGYTNSAFAGNPLGTSGWGLYVAGAGTMYHWLGTDMFKTVVPIVTTSTVTASGAGNFAGVNISSGSSLTLAQGDIQFQSNSGYGILTANSSRLMVIQNGQLTMQGILQMGAYQLGFNEGGVRSWIINTSSGNLLFNSGDGGGNHIFQSNSVSANYYDAQYAGAYGNYNGKFDWNLLQLGNNGPNYIVGGHAVAGGWLDFYVNNTNNVVGSTPNGVHAMRINNTGYIHSYLTFTAPNFQDFTGPYNVNLGSGGNEGRGLVAGYSGGNYGGIGYNIRHTGTSSSWIAPGGDNVSYLSFNAGFTFLYAVGGAAGRDITSTLLTAARLEGDGTFYPNGAIYPGFNNTSTRSAQSTYYLHGQTSAAGIRTNGNFIVENSIYAGEQYSYGYFRNLAAGYGLYNQVTTAHFYSSSAVQWDFATSGGSYIQIALRAGGHGSQQRGYLYADTSNNVGLLGYDGNWALRMDAAKTLIGYNGAQFVNDVSTTAGQGRFGGWYTGSNFTGAAVEVGYSGGTGNVIAYNRNTGVYSPIYLAGSEVNLTPQGGSIRATGNIVMSNYGLGLVGLYNSTLFQAVFAMGESYMLPNNGANTGSLYGLAWAHPNAGGQAANLGTHGLLVVQNGTTIAAISNNLWVSNNVIASGDIYHGTRSVWLSSWLNQAVLTTSNVTFNTVYASGNITAYSDARLKENVFTIDNALNKVMGMRGVYFNRIGILGPRETGVIAQEVMSVLPEVVHKNGDIHSVAYGNIVGVLIEAIKELKQELNDLKTIANGPSE